MAGDFAQLWSGIVPSARSLSQRAIINAAAFLDVQASRSGSLWELAIFYFSLSVSWVSEMLHRLYTYVLVALSLQAASDAAILPRCKISTFSNALPSNALIERIAPVASGGSFGEGAANIPYPTNPTQLPELCALIVRVESSPESSFRFGLFLPTNWTTRFLAVGNGGFSGGINWLDMAPGPHYGMATISTDTGHSSNAIDMTWALNRPESKTDWGWRAMSGSVSLGKRLTEAYYRRDISRAYYNGCSSGGRQGLKQIQLDAESFDGILVGAPAWYTSHLNPFAVQVSGYNLPANDPKHMTLLQFGIVSDEVVRQCDEADGVKDSIVSAPDNCTFSFAPITCGLPGVNPLRCITKRQVRTVQDIYSDWVASDGTLLYPGLTKGSEWNFLAIAVEQEAPWGMSFLRFFLYDNPFLTSSSFNESVVFDAERINPGNVTADKYDLSEFRSSGGKIIMYHGLADGIVPIQGSDLYYDRVSQATTNGNESELRSFFRYFKLPGVQHCWGTPETSRAPWNIGGAGQAGATGSDQWSIPGFRDADHDALLALVRWVEEDVPVEKIVATNWVRQLDSGSGVLRQRPICAVPERQVWDGVGDLDLPGSWRCA